MALSPKELWKLIHVIIVIASLELFTYDNGMQKRRHMREIAEKTWRDEASEQFKQSAKAFVGEEKPF